MGAEPLNMRTAPKEQQSAQGSQHRPEVVPDWHVHRHGGDGGRDARARQVHLREAEAEKHDRPDSMRPHGKQL